MNLSADNFSHKITALITQGIANWVEAGKLLVQFVEEYPDAYASLIAGEPRLTPDFLGNLEALGRGTLHPDLLYLKGPGPNKARLLPYSEQVRVLSQLVEVVVDTPAGTDILLVDIRAMSPKQAQQVFADGHMRTRGEQQAWRMARKAEEPPALPPAMEEPFYRVVRGEIHITRPVKLGTAELAMLITQLSR